MGELALTPIPERRANRKLDVVFIHGLGDNGEASACFKVKRHARTKRWISRTHPSLCLQFVVESTPLRHSHIAKETIYSFYLLIGYGMLSYFYSTDRAVSRATLVDSLPARSSSVK
jgi:hypothetical protein